MTGLSGDTQENGMAAAPAAAIASEQALGDVEAVAAPEPAELDEDVVISSYLLSTVKGETAEAALAISQIAGVEVHDTIDTTLVVTIEAPTIDASTKVAAEVNASKGIISMRLIYANFEDDPVIKAHRLAYVEKKAQENK